MNILETRNIKKRYTGHLALDGVSISIPEGVIFGLLGPNGAGKTTFIRIVTQIIARDEGEVFFAGEELAPKHAAQIGYMPEERGLYKKMKVAEQLLYLGQLKGMTKTDAKNSLKIWGEKLGIAGWWDKKTEDLSKGMQQKVQFVATVMHGPRLIILDEPFSGFDPVNADLIKEEILGLKKSGHTIIFSTHRMESVEELCEHIVLIDRSKIVLQGTTAAVKNAYKDDTFLVETANEILLPPGAELIAGGAIAPGHFVYTVKIAGGDLNAFLPQLIANGNRLLGVKEKVPSINEIFIKTVKKN